MIGCAHQLEGEPACDACARKWLGIGQDARSRSALLCAECALPVGYRTADDSIIYRTSRDDFGRTYCLGHKHLWGTTR